MIKESINRTLPSKLVSISASRFLGEARHLRGDHPILKLLFSCLIQDSSIRRVWLVWIRSIFIVLIQYYSFMKIPRYEKLWCVWVEETLWFSRPYNTIVFLDFRKIHSNPLFKNQAKIAVSIGHMGRESPFVFCISFDCVTYFKTSWTTKFYVNGKQGIFS